MLTLIIISIIALMIGYYFGKKSNPFDWKKFIVVMFVGAIVYGITIGIGRILLYNKYTEVVYHDLPIESLTNKDNWELNGSFVLGSGSINGGSYTSYITYGKFKSGLKRLKLNTDHYYLKESDSKKPCIERYWKFQIYHPYKSIWFWNRKYSKDEYMREVDSYFDHRTIIVPTNTVYKNFNIKD
jgi:hypothetical protein